MSWCLASTLIARDIPYRPARKIPSQMSPLIPSASNALYDGPWWWRVTPDAATATPVLIRPYVTQDEFTNAWAYWFFSMPSGPALSLKTQYSPGHIQYAITSWKCLMATMAHALEPISDNTYAKAMNFWPKPHRPIPIYAFSQLRAIWAFSFYSALSDCYISSFPKVTSLFIEIKEARSRASEGVLLGHNALRIFSPSPIHAIIIYYASLMISPACSMIRPFPTMHLSYYSPASSTSCCCRNAMALTYRIVALELSYVLSTRWWYFIAAFRVLISSPAYIRKCTLGFVPILLPKIAYFILMPLGFWPRTSISVSRPFTEWVLFLGHYHDLMSLSLFAHSFIFAYRRECTSFISMLLHYTSPRWCTHFA